MADKPIMRLYIKRPNGAMIPLIALDELPKSVELGSIPLTLTRRQAKHMRYVGTFSRVPLSTTIHTQSDIISSTGSITTFPQFPDQQPHHSRTFSETPSDIESASNKDQKSTIGKKTHCTYWIRYGECSFAQQGCMFQHEMPTTKEALNAIGFKDIPAWYRIKYGVGSLQAVAGSDAAMGRVGISHRNDISKSQAGDTNSRNDRQTAEMPSKSSHHHCGGKFRRLTTRKLSEDSDTSPEISQKNSGWRHGKAKQRSKLSVNRKGMPMATHLRTVSSSNASAEPLELVDVDDNGPEKSLLDKQNPPLQPTTSESSSDASEVSQTSESETGSQDSCSKSSHSEGSNEL